MTTEHSPFRKHPYLPLLLSILGICVVLNLTITYVWLHRPKQNPQVSQNDIKAMMELFMAGGQSRTWAGNYLSSRYAQGQFDWARARDFLKSVEDQKTPSQDMARRLMLLSMGTGDFDTARTQLKLVDQKNDETGLSTLLEFIVAVRADDQEKALVVLKEARSTPILSYARPHLLAWVTASHKTVSKDVLTSLPSFYQQVLIADYMGQVKTFIDPALAKRAAEKMPALTALQVGDVFLRNGMFDVAQAFYEQASLLTEMSSELEARIAAASKKEKVLAEPYVLTMPPKTVTDGVARVFFDMATSFYVDQSFESAQLFANMALSMDPNLVDARLMMGHLFLQNNRMDRAIEVFKGIPSTYPRYAFVQKQIADLYVEQGDKKAALSILKEQVASSSPEEQVSLYLQMGDIYQDEQQYRDALSSYEGAARATEETGQKPGWEVLYARGMVLERLQRWDEAEKDLLTALALKPNHPYILNYLGYSWADRGIKLDEAQSYLERAVAQMPDDGAIVDSLGWVYYRLGHYDKAVSTLERAVQLMPFDPTINDHLGDAYWHVGRKREARFQWHRAYNAADNEPTVKESVKQKMESGIIPIRK